MKTEAFSNSYLIRKAIEDFLEDQEDYTLAQARFVKKEYIL